jgi:molybdopterin/thiamine biosynthesis adenylyltransferase/rhodanese-related sulfurtransferase
MEPAPPARELSRKEVARYSRHLLLPEVGQGGQKALKAASVLIVGAGGLGSPAAMYLAAAGVGTLGIADPDVVDLTNLQRQLLHATTDIGRPKTDSARDTIGGINPHVTVHPIGSRLDSGNALQILAPYDVIIDGSDNFPTRYLLNDACVILGKPNVYGSVFRFEGQASVFYPKAGGPCYRCLYPAPPPPGLVPSCAEGGVLGVLPGIIGSLQALEAIKLIIGQGDTLTGTLLLFDALGPKFRELTLNRNPGCPACGDNPTIRTLIDYEDFCGVTHGAGGTEDQAAITVEELKSRLDRGEQIFLLDVREPLEHGICNLGGHLIPPGELSSRFSELDRSREIVVYCKTGVRSARAVEMLREKGFTKLRNLKGGIDAWADRIDHAMARY